MPATPDAPTTILFIRHGEVHNPQQIYYGRLPGFPLNETGREQARAAARHLQDAPLAAVYSSPRQRALETAEAVLEVHSHLRVKTSELLDEVFTPYDGWAYAALQPRNFDLYTGTQPPYEQPVDVLRRAREFCGMMPQQYQGKYIAAVTHGDVIAFLILWAKGSPLELKRRHTLTALGLRDDYPAHASITSLTFATSPSNLPRSCDYTRLD